MSTDKFPRAKLDSIGFGLEGVQFTDYPAPAPLTVGKINFGTDLGGKDFTIEHHIIDGGTLTMRTPTKRVVTDEMVATYLRANDAYWKHQDTQPTPIGTWRTGSVNEATRESLQAVFDLLKATP